MQKLQNREIVFSQSFLVPKGELVSFECQIRSSQFQVEITFSQEVSGSEPLIEWKLESGVLKMVFKNWKSSLGTSLKKPAKLGDVDNLPCGFNAAHYLIGDIDYVHIEIYCG